MQLTAVLVPSPGAMDDPLATLHDIFCPDPVEAPSRSRIRLLRRPKHAAAPELAWQPNPAETVAVRVCTFGNVTGADALALTTALERVAQSWAAPVVSVADIRIGQTAPFSVTAGLSGEVDEMVSVFGDVVSAARREGYFLDRRSFRAEVALGTITVPWGATVPESLPGTVIPVHGPSWSLSHLRLLRASHAGPAAIAQEFATIPLHRHAIRLGTPAGDRDARTRLTA